ncbi:MAG: hypothetical protein GXO75_21520 [Calditrichaeota bacterium]|nr:hypothetical protein [Calditrichota bacterium]
MNRTCETTLARGREEFGKYYTNILEEKKKRFDVLDAYLFIAPSVLLFLVFLLIPIAISIYIAFAKNRKHPDGRRDPGDYSGYHHLFFVAEADCQKPVNYRVERMMRKVHNY